VVGSLKSAQVEIEEASRTLAAYGRGVASDPGRLAEAEERLEAIRRLCRKHGGDVAAVLARREQMRHELSSISRHAERLEELAALVAERGGHALALAQELSKRRKKAAASFAQAVEAELGRLAMGKTVFKVALEREEESAEGGQSVEGVRLSARGIDRCELMISPNPGEEVKPLSRIASGGELSRVMLAIKRALARTDPVPTYVFDEVDSGIGGAVAEVVGRLLKEVSKDRQVLCITHLPQIAACADHHFTVEKKVKEGRTSSRVELLSESARTRELARMLAGVEVTGAALKNAEEMLQAAQRVRRTRG
jgi:DNA repair protein RecN (Recombination protein N)